MTNSVSRAAGTAAAMESSPWAPLRQRVFAALWVGVLISGMGTWMQTLGAQWLLIHKNPNAAPYAAGINFAASALTGAAVVHNHMLK